MSRKVLGVQRPRTIAWMVTIKNCLKCKQLALMADAPFPPTNRIPTDATNAWLDLQQHIWTDHADEEYCLNCSMWMDDTLFAEHLNLQHNATWSDIKISEKDHF